MNFKLLNDELLKKLTCDIFEFRKTFGLVVNSKISAVDDEFHTSLIVEELHELSEANTDVNRADAIVDSVYVLMGRYVHYMGYSNDYSASILHVKYMVDVLLQVAEKSNFDFIACWDNIHASNMSKVCTSIDEAELTISKYRESGVSTYYEQVGKYYTVKRTTDGKVLKSINYTPADLSNCLYKKWPLYLGHFTD